MREFASLDTSDRERLLQTIIDSEPECVKVVGLDGTLRMMNPAGLRMIEADSADQVVGQPLLPLVAPEHRGAFLALTDHVFRGGQGTLEFRATGLKGTSRWLETHAVPLRDDRGRVTALLGITRDITDRKRADAALRQSENSFRMLFEQATDGIFVTDAVGAILDVNCAGCAMTGYSREELLSRTIGDLAHPDERERVGPEVARLSSGEIITTEWRSKRKDGTEFIAEARAKQLPDGRLQAFCRDITDRKQAEVTQARLAQAHRMETVGRLAGGIAHDFNNLLTVILATADVALSAVDEHHALHDDLEQIRLAGDRAAMLTRQLLALSRQQIVKPEVLNLNTIVADMNDVVRRLIGENIELRLGLLDPLGHIKADAGQVEQIILNLVLNARDAMPDGGTLAIETDQLLLDAAQALEFPPARPGPHVRLAVRDTGVGMDDVTRQRLFEPFYTTKSRGQGTGLGLAMVYGAVKQSGGTVQVQSARGQGTTVSVYLPIVIAEPAPKPVQQEPTPVRGSETILIVEDEGAIRALSRRILQEAGYTVLDAASGEDALAVIARHRGAIALLFTDVVMPRMTGRDLAGRVAAVRPEIKVLFASGYTDDAILRHGVLDDPRRFLSKPYTATQLRAKVRGVLDD